MRATVVACSVSVRHDEGRSAGRDSSSSKRATSRRDVLSVSEGGACSQTNSQTSLTDSLTDKLTGKLTDKLSSRTHQKTDQSDLSRKGSSRIQNRLPMLLPHIPWYSIEGPARLAADVGVSRSTISRLMSGKCSPSYRLVAAVSEALSRRLDASLDEALPSPLDPREIFTTDGTYPTPSACDLCHCSGCLPDYAFRSSGERYPEYRHMQPGDWCRSPLLA